MGVVYSLAETDRKSHNADAILTGSCEVASVFEETVKLKDLKRNNSQYQKGLNDE